MKTLRIACYICIVLGAALILRYRFFPVWPIVNKEYLVHYKQERISSSLDLLLEDDFEELYADLKFELRKSGDLYYYFDDEKKINGIVYIYASS